MASRSGAADWQSKILKKEYQNWLAVGHALSLMLDGLRPYIEREMKTFHQALLANLAAQPPCTCVHPTKHTCAWCAQLARCHVGGKPKWHQSDRTAWTDPHRGYWEVAKLFMAELGGSKAAVVDASTTDCTGLMNLMFWCVHFRVQNHLIAAVRETRNTKWGHAPRQELTDAEKANALLAIKDLLQDPELVADSGSKSALAEICLMEKAFDAQSVERKVLADFQVAIQYELGDIRLEMRTFKGNCRSASNKIKKKLCSLEKRQASLGKLLQDTNERMEEMKRRNLPYSTSAWNLLGRALVQSKRIFVGNLRSLKSKSILIWTFFVVLLGCFTCLSHHSYNDGCPLEIGDILFDTKEFNFTSHLNAAREGFTGRHWLYHNLESLFLNSQVHSVGGVVVVGEPGAGKSALSAELICSRSSNAYIHKRIIGYHLCKYSDKTTQDPGRFVRNLVDLIARRVPEYEMLIHNSSFIPRILQRSCLRDPFDCFEQAVATPLQQLKNDLQYYFVVVDALDECSSDDSGATIVQFIRDSHKKLPKWIRWILTSRNDSIVLKVFNSFPKLYLSSTDARNLQDIEVYIATKLFEDAPFLGRLKVMLGLSSSDEVSYLTNKLLLQSQGNFHFAKEMLHFWKNDPHSVDLNKLPKTIGEQYEKYLRRAYGSREKFKPALAILEVLVAAFEPIQVSDLFDVLKIREKIDYEYDFVYTLKGLSHFIRYGENNAINLFHLSFIEWLASKENLGNPYYVSRTRGHRRLVEYYLNLVKKAPNRTMHIYRLAQHMCSDDHRDDHQGHFRSIDAFYVNATIDTENRTLLHLSAAKSDQNVLLLLRPAFQNIDCEDSHGFTPAFVAAMNGLAQNVDFLINEGANIKHRTRPPPGYIWGDPIKRSKTAFWNSTMMHAAASGGHSDVVHLLLRWNASFNDVNGVNLTAIQLAAEKGHLKIVQLLYERGAPLHHLSLQYAAYGGHADMVAFLLNIGVADNCMRCDGSFYWVGNRSRYQVTPGDAKGYILSDDSFKIFCQSALHLSVAKNHTKVAKLLLSQDDKVVHCRDFAGRTPLHEAVRQNHVQMAELLIKNGASVSRRCRYFQNLSSPDNLQSGEHEDKSSPYAKLYLSVEEIIKYNKDVCPCGSTPFLLAARYGHIDVAALLLRHGARPHDMDCQGATPLHVAACHGHYDFIKWLVSQRPSLHIHLKSKNQSTPLHSSAICKNNKDIKPLIEMGASIYETDQYGMTPLHYTVLNAFQKIQTTTSYDNVYDPSFTENTFILESKLLNFQCSKVAEISKSADIFYIDKVDEHGRTALHLAAQSGDECSVRVLLLKGARTELTDDKGRTPLDIAIEFSTEELNTFLISEAHNGRITYRTVDESFNLRRTLNRIYHDSVVDILLSREAYLVQMCDERRTSLLHKAFESEKPIMADIILSKGGLLSCKDDKGRTPLLIYLQNGGKWLDVVLKRFNATIKIECGKPFNISEFHLASFREPSVKSGNFLEQRFCDAFQCFFEDGPLAKAIKAHPRGFGLINECRDAEGYTALHRAAQGGNVLALETFISWGADPSLLTPQGHTALDHAIMAGISPLSVITTRNTSEKAADLLLRATRRISGLDVGCNSADEAKLTIYHLAAYAGLSGLVKTLLKDKRLLGVDVNCSNVHGITPLYLAKLHVGSEDVSDGEKDPWQEIVDLIEKNGGILTYPNRHVELYVLYNHIFGSYPDRFTLDPFEDNSKLFYESDVSQCRERDLDHYSTGTMLNPYMEPLINELKHLMTSKLIPHQIRVKALFDLNRLRNDALNGMKRTEIEIIRRRKQADTSATRSMNFPKSIKPSIVLGLLNISRGMEQQEQVPRELQFSHESTKAIVSHVIKHLKLILHKYSRILGDTRNIMEVFEKYEESNLCQEEIFQAKLIKMKFDNYDLKSRSDDFLSFILSSRKRTEFTFKRCPREWLQGDTNGESTLYWNEAVKFIYQMAFQMEPTIFDYLQSLSLGCDKDTRIPLSVETFRWGD